MLQAVCKLKAEGTGKVSGTLNFYQATEASDLIVSGPIVGLSDGDHGFHVHELADLTKGCTGAGGHYNPKKVNHGAPGSLDTARHVGDFGNIKAVGLQTTQLLYTDKIAKMSGTETIIGRSIVIHAGRDDLGAGTGVNLAGSQASGNAGAREACCVITKVVSTAIPNGGRCERVLAKTGTRPACKEGTTSCCGTAALGSTKKMETCADKLKTKINYGGDLWTFTCELDNGAVSKMATSISAAVAAAYMMA